MGNDLMPYDSFEELSNIVLSSGSSSSNPVIKLVGEFTTALFKPVTDWKKLDKLETLIIVKGRQDAEVKKKAIETIRQALNSGMLAPDAQLKALEMLDRILSSNY